MRNTLLYLFVFIFIISILSNCKREAVELDVIPLNLKRANYNGDELKIDGYYFHEWESDATQFLIFVLYKNGIIVYANNPPDSGKEDMEESFLDGTFYNYKKKSEHIGVFSESIPIQ